MFIATEFDLSIIVPVMETSDELSNTIQLIISAIDALRSDLQEICDIDCTVEMVFPLAFEAKLTRPQMLMLSEHRGTRVIHSGVSHVETLSQVAEHGFNASFGVSRVYVHRNDLVPLNAF